MLIIPGRAGRTCEGPTRRELLRTGSLGIAGLNLAGLFRLTEGGAGQQYRRQQVRWRARLRQLPSP